MKICLKVLGVKMPLSYLWKPLFRCRTELLVIIEVFLYFVPLLQIFSNLVGSIVGGVIYTVVMVAIGVLIFLTLGLLCDVMNLEDGAFWKSVIDGFGPLKSLMKPL